MANLSCKAFLRHANTQSNSSLLERLFTIHWFIAGILVSDIHALLTSRFVFYIKLAVVLSIKLIKNHASLVVNVHQIQSGAWLSSRTGYEPIRIFLQLEDWGKA